MQGRDRPSELPQMFRAPIVDRVGWEEAYAGPPPPWDIGRAQPAVVRLADAGAFRGRVLDAGCGTGENALELAARGLQVWGVDGASRAIAAARAKASRRGVDATFEVGDALELDGLGQTFDTVLDCGLFHTFDDEDRTRYVNSLASVVEAGGAVHVLCFSDLEPGVWGPRRVTQAEIRDAFAEGWRVVEIRMERFATRLTEDGARASLATVERS